MGEGIKPIPVPALPPYNGFGSFEDSEQSCKNLVRPTAMQSCQQSSLFEVRGTTLYA